LEAEVEDAVEFRHQEEKTQEKKAGEREEEEEDARADTEGRRRK
jgi:hypothetical protein